MIFRLSSRWSWLWCYLLWQFADNGLARQPGGCTFTHLGVRSSSSQPAKLTSSRGWDPPVVRSAYLSCRAERKVFNEASDAFLRIPRGSRHQSHLVDDEEEVDPENQDVSSSRQDIVVKQTRSVRSPTPSEPVSAEAADAGRGGAVAAAALAAPRALVFWENMVAGAASRSVAQTVMHPANTMKTILQSSRTPETILQMMKPKNFRRLTRGAGANFILSLPNGAVNFAVLEFVRSRLSMIVENTEFLRKRANRIGPGLDFLSSAISTVCTSVVSTPQMMVVDNIMAGNYPGLSTALSGLANSKGLPGFYAGWWPGLAGKIPSYALTWTLFQQLKNAHRRIYKRPAKDFENSIMGCIASGATVCIMIPMDTIKTRLVTQTGGGLAAGAVPYKGILDCAIRVSREEGVRALYRGLPPRLFSVMPMIGIQFGVYEYMKKVMVDRDAKRQRLWQRDEDTYTKEEVLEEASMEVSASQAVPLPAPKFKSKYRFGK